MFDDWKKRRKLKRALRTIGAEFEPKLKAAGDSKDIRSKVEAEYQAQIQGPWEQLRWSETSGLRIKAFRFGIELPPHDDKTCWDSAHFWEKVGAAYTPAQTLTPKGIAILSRQISEARLNYWKRWVEIVSQITTVLIALFALAISLLALYLQLFGTADIAPVK